MFLPCQSAISKILVCGKQTDLSLDSFIPKVNSLRSPVVKLNCRYSPKHWLTCFQYSVAPQCSQRPEAGKVIPKSFCIERQCKN